MSPQDEHLLQGLRARTLALLDEVVGVGRSVALLDAPNQRNVGDTLIWLGERAYLKELKASVVYVADMHGYSEHLLRRMLPADGVILLHGGGNLGDIWLGHQEHREAIVRDFPDRQIVQLPQSVWFGSDSRAQTANALLGAHPNLTILVRDGESALRASQQLPDVTSRYCWDMALGWTPKQPRARKESLLVIARADKEGASGLRDADFTTEVGLPVRRVDWTSELLDSRGWRVARMIPKLAAHFPRLRRWKPFQALVRYSIGRINYYNARGGVHLFSGSRLVVADRLHAHILAVLMGIDNVLLDNNYGKLGAVHRDYTKDFSTAHYANDVPESMDIVKRVLEGS
jgi:exopolysaccharide biosynthesis predicted pyruvyltransferase EpsI